MSGLPLLSLVTFVPLLGGALILVLPGASNARWIALGTTIVTFALSLMVWASFDNSNPGFQLVEKLNWLGGGISYHMGVDGISMLFVVLTAGLMPFCIAASWESVEKRVAEYMIAFLVLETMMIGVFCALDLVLFYVLFEAGLIPMFLIIGIWGGKRRVYASFKFFLYTFVGSVLMLLAIMSMYWYTGTTDIVALLASPHFPPQMQIWLWLAFFASFAVKMPMWPVHTWLPDAHVEAPTAGSVILAGILLKMGGYGFLRFSLPITPDASASLDGFMIALSLVAVVYIGLVALAQQDMKKLIAYSSISHMGFVTLGLFAVFDIFAGTNDWKNAAMSIEGAMVQMISHGFVSGALFLCVGVLYDRLHSRQINDYGGVANTMPKFAAFMLLFAMANTGLPGTSGFVGEFLIILSVFKASFWYAFLAGTTLIIGAAYTLWMYKRVVFGEIRNAKVAALTDINGREAAILTSLAVLVLVLGLWPAPLLDMMHASVQHLVEQVAQSKLSVAAHE